MAGVVKERKERSYDPERNIVDGLVSVERHKELCDRIDALLRAQESTDIVSRIDALLLHNEENAVKAMHSKKVIKRLRLFLVVSIVVAISATYAFIQARSPQLLSNGREYVEAINGGVEMNPAQVDHIEQLAKDGDLDAFSAMLFHLQSVERNSADLIDDHLHSSSLAVRQRAVNVMHQMGHDGWQELADDPEIGEHVRNLMAGSYWPSEETNGE